MRALLASPLGFLIGISLGALGGGGSILAVPALVYAAGQTPKHATTTSLVLVALTAMIGIVPHWRARRVRFVAGTIFGLAGIGGSLLGSHWNKAADPNVLLLAFSGLMMIAAYGMWRRVHNNPRLAPALSVGAAAAPFTTPSIRIEPMTVLKVVVAGTIVGLLTGFFGVGGGFVIVPALVLALGFTIPEAIGTSLLVITINTAVALTTRLQAGSIEWATVIPFTIASLLGVIVGSRLASKHDSSSLQRWFVGLLVVVAIYTAIRSGLAL
ncbi:MAG: sulfite exporter TauE/SafE family protein, partial [Ilumatobacteraceae bacterium]